jgi:hypothetical protein
VEVGWFPSTVTDFKIGGHATASVGHSAIATSKKAVERPALRSNVNLVLVISSSSSRFQ